MLDAAEWSFVDPFLRRVRSMPKVCPEKLEMLGSVVSCLASPRKILGEHFLSIQGSIKHPEMHKKLKVGKFFWRWKKFFWGEKKFWMKKNFGKKNCFSKNESCLKLPELPRNHLSRWGVAMDRQTTTMDRQTTGWHHRVMCRVAPCEQQSATNKKQVQGLELQPWTWLNTCLAPSKPSGWC